MEHVLVMNKNPLVFAILALVSILVLAVIVSLFSKETARIEQKRPQVVDPVKAE